MRREILELQRKLKLTTIFVTHDQEEANTISDRIAVLDEGILQQVGSPMDLYDSPVNRFVADFLGTANLLDGGVEVTGEGTRFVAAGGLILPLGGEGHAPGDGRIAMFRPQDATISAADPAMAATAFAGRVGHREFLGNLIRYTVAVDEDTSLLVDDTHQPGRRAFSVGDKVTVNVDMRHVQILTG